MEANPKASYREAFNALVRAEKDQERGAREEFDRRVSQ
jgi:hypothetical protein